MILPKALAVSVQLITVVATGDRVPQLNVEPVCKGIAEQGGVTFRDPAIPQEKKNCIESELAVRQELIKQWSSFSADDRTHCINETTMGGESSYTELLTCLEMARDVRVMRAEAASSRATVPRAPSSPSKKPTVQPAPAEPVSRPTSANEPPKLEVHSTLKELERAKADAQNATASEALAHAEVALQRTKEETERATNEAQRAKADAQAARESEAAAMRKLADAEAARTAAEGRCQNAAKSQPGLGARLRKWFASERAKVQAALAEPASRPISANEHPKLEVDSTLKELERAKADAQNATASEALAHAEAALQRAKEETERATNEAQRAKADTQAARESEAAAKRKLADAEAARTVAEGRCQSAAKRQPGLGARLRKWFASERANPKNP